MSRLQLTRIEQLDSERPELKLELEISRQLRAGDTLEEIRAFIQAKTGEKLSIQNISHYKQTRWLRRKQRIEAIKERSEAILGLLGERGVSEVAQAQLFEKVDDAMREGAKFDPNCLLTEQRKWAELELKRQQLEQANRKLELQISQMKVEAEKATDEVAKKISEGQSATVDDINSIRQRTFGLPPLAAGTPA